MKKFLSFALIGFMTLGLVTAVVEAKDANKIKVNRQSKKYDIIKNKEYAQIKKEFFAVEEYGDIYNCPVEKQKFCKVKNLSSGFYTLCDRDVTRTQMESAKLIYQLGRCIKMN